jgi:hypothetical protein
MQHRDILFALVAAGGLAVAPGCSGGSAVPASPEFEALGGTALFSINPVGGSTNVGLGQSIEIRFSNPMHPEAAKLVAVHSGDLGGPVVEGAWMWWEGYTRLTFTPGSAWQPATEYTIHMGGGMMGAGGSPMDFQSQGPAMGGQWATSEMMDADMNGGSMMGSRENHMGYGWHHLNGTYGMVFRFRTAD